MSTLGLGGGNERRAGVLAALLAVVGGQPAPAPSAPAPSTPADAPPAASAPAVPPATSASPSADTTRDAAPAIASYTLSARLDGGAGTLHGEGTLSWVNGSRASVDELYFHLYLNAFENDKTLFNRSAFTRARSGRATRRWGHVTLTRLTARELGGVDLLPSLEPHSPGDPLDRTDRRLPLPRPIAPGESLSLELAWDATLPSIVERTGVSGDFYLVGQWFPKLARLEPDGTWAHFPFHPHAEFYADYGDYDVTLDVPESMQVGATGHRLSEQVEGGRRVVRQQQKSVHDFAWTAWPAFQRREERIDGVDVHLLYPPGHDRNAEQTLAALRFALPHFGQRYGAYPYADLTVVHPPAHAAAAGGMEYPTLITTGGPWHQAYWSRAVEIVTIHELGHQWFYGLLGSNEQRYPFLDEGLNSYAETVALEALFGPASASSVLGFQLSETALHRAGMLFGPHDAPIAQAAGDFVDFNELGALVYSRTALLFRTLAEVYGPERLERGLGDYARRYRFTHPGPEELLGALDGALGADAALNLRRALFEGAGVNYSIRELRSVTLAAQPTAGAPDAGDEGDTGSHAGARYESRVVVHRAGELELPVGVLLITSDGQRFIHRWDGHGRDEVITHVGGSPVVSAQVDPDDAIAIDDNLLDNASRVDRPAPLAVWDRVGYTLELLLGGLTP
ncbi:MAG TPA: M1 family metallopeptidase [Polyangiaceae bacterium]|nr:M1 family metallopeptidase [Polyangiaceae bacterium]